MNFFFLFKNLPKVFLLAILEGYTFLMDSRSEVFNFYKELMEELASQIAK